MSAEQVTEQDETPGETLEERIGRLAGEKKALRLGQSGDALPERLLALLGCNLYTSIDGAEGPTQESALLKYAAATTKAVGMALLGTDYVCANEPFETSFSTEEAAIVLCGLSSLLDGAPDLIQDIRDASGTRGAS